LHCASDFPLLAAKAPLKLPEAFASGREWLEHLRSACPSPAQAQPAEALPCRQAHARVGPASRPVLPLEVYPTRARRFCRSYIANFATGAQAIIVKFM
jgi:hypothetical protein